MFDIEMFIGRFHPLLVHLPIGFIFLAFVFKILQIKKGTNTFGSALKIVLLLSSIAAVFACATGFLLSRSSSYPDGEINVHMWAGIMLALITATWYFLEKSPDYNPLLIKGIAAMAGVVLLLTGHWGGNLTHGRGYLLQGLPPGIQNFLGSGASESVEPEFNIFDIDSAAVYSDIVQPILEARCYSCHNDRKQKGELRLDSPEHIRTGGESGDPLIAESIENSKIYHTLTLPKDDDLHMPPKGKTQLTEFEIEALGAWAGQGGDFEKRLFRYEDQKAIRAWYDDHISDRKLYANPLIPEESAPVPDASAIAALEEEGVLIQPLGNNSTFLEISFINVPEQIPAGLPSIEKLAENVIWLDLTGHEITDEIIEKIARLPRITQLDLSDCRLPENTLQRLSVLQKIQVLNLTGASMDATDLDVLENWENLKKVYTYRSSLSGEAIKAFRTQHPGITVDTGGYTLPSIPEDTIIYKFKRE